MYKQAVTRDEILDLNKIFYNKRLLPYEFYLQFKEQGFELSACVLVSIFPDSSDTYFGRVIRQDGDMFEFDVDLATANYSSWINITGDFKALYERRRLTKPWLSEIVAFELFKEGQVV